MRRVAIISLICLDGCFGLTSFAESWSCNLKRNDGPFASFVLEAGRKPSVSVVWTVQSDRFPKARGADYAKPETLTKVQIVKSRDTKKRHVFPIMPRRRMITPAAISILRTTKMPRMETGHPLFVPLTAIRMKSRVITAATWIESAICSETCSKGIRIHCTKSWHSNWMKLKKVFFFASSADYCVNDSVLVSTWV